MGLAERRALESYKGKELVDQTKQLNDAAGFAVPLEIRWDTLKLEAAYVDRAAELMTKVYMTPLINGIKAVATDDMGKQAVKSGLKKIIIDGSEGISPYSFSFENGELLIKHLMDTNVDDVADRTKGIQKLLEDKL